MARKNKKISEQNKAVEVLSDLRYSLLSDLYKKNQEFIRYTSDEFLNMDNWISGFPIESLHSLANDKRRTRLGDLKNKKVIKENIKNILKELEVVDDKIRAAEIDLVSIKISSLLKVLEK